MNRVAHLILPFLLVSSIGSPGQAADSLASTDRAITSTNRNPLPGTTPARRQNACLKTDVMASIVRQFGYKATHYLKSDIAIVEIRDMHLRRFNPKDEDHLVGREYCGGTALTSDGVIRPIWYLIEHDFAPAGLGSSVEFCLEGLDPSYVYGARCASLK